MAILGSIVVVGQERLMEWMRRYLLHASLLQPLIMPMRYAVWRTRHGFYDGIRQVAVVMALLATVVSAGFILGKDELFLYWNQAPEKTEPASKTGTETLTLQRTLPPQPAN